jgi:hypothetical protein
VLRSARFADEPERDRTKQDECGEFHVRSLLAACLVAPAGTARIFPGAARIFGDAGAVSSAIVENRDALTPMGRSVGRALCKAPYLTYMGDFHGW